jgi:DNA-binding NarL/FixJ family response regulator
MERDPMKRIALVEDHPLVLVGLRATLEAHGYDVIYAGAQLAPATSLNPPPDVVLLDLELEDSFVDPQCVVHAQQRGIKVLVVSALASPLAIRQILDVGVAGFVSKSESTEVLLEALAVVASGGWWTSPQIAIAIFSDVRCPQLSHQEQRALTLYASGLKLDAVARSMEISAHSAKTYIDRVRAKYAAVGRPVTGKIDLYREAHRDGYLPD